MFIFLLGPLYLNLLIKSNCDSEIYCRGPLLEKVQLSGLFIDSKQFVDMPTIYSKAKVLKSFSELGENATNVELKQFVKDNFQRPGFEMKIIIPKDWNKNPKFLKKLDSNKKLKDFAEAIHAKWKGLTRRFDQRKICENCLASSLKLPYPFIVPGGRFREFYYWDSYWILEGLYVSEMCETSGGIIENMLVMIEEVGFVPNGARIYYMNRSQPPLLCMMIERYLEECVKTEIEKIEFLKRALPFLEKEYSFWMKERSSEVLLGNNNITLNIYRAEHWVPRPESYVEDLATSSLPKFDSDIKKQVLFQNIASAAESGWDFSGRWIERNRSETGLEGIDTVMIVPVDLNVFMLQNEKLIASFYERINPSHERIEIFKMKAVVRERHIFELFWNESSWVDFDLGKLAKVNRSFYISDLAPLWFLKNGDLMEKVISQNFDILFKYPGGIPASEDFTGQQWDFPNVWAPMQHLIINALLVHDNREYGEYYKYSLNVSQRFINSVYCGFERFGQIFEKYHAVKVGYPGGGGEYIVQEGFGWTNGVTLWILDKFGSNLTLPADCVIIDQTSIVNIEGIKQKSASMNNNKGTNRRISVILSSFILKIFLFFKLA